MQRLHPGAVVPARAHDGDAGMDLVSVEHCTLQPGERAVVGTGIAIEVPSGWAALACPRSGLAAQHGIGVVNGPGVVDAGYRGEVRVVLHNSDKVASFTIEPGDRIAQLVLTPVFTGAIVEVDELSTAARAADGFGSTGGFAASTSVGHSPRSTS
ncbi:MAG: dUTP diphosphatase [Thermoleophilia bacterium]|nr:dUTP diphosphatase [Thermoleophilia bacterium]